MLIVYKRVPERTLRKEAKDVAKQITKWFEANPKRRVCRANVWYGRTYSIKRKDIEGQLTKIVNDLIKEK